MAQWGRGLSAGARNDIRQGVMGNRKTDRKKPATNDAEDVVMEEAGSIAYRPDPTEVTVERLDASTPESPSSSVYTQPNDLDPTDTGNAAADGLTDDRTVPHTPVPSRSTLPSSDGTALSPDTTTTINSTTPRLTTTPSKLKVVMKLRRRQRITPSKTKPPPTTPHKSTSIGRFFSARGEQIEDDETSDSPPSVVAEDEGAPMSPPPEDEGVSPSLLPGDEGERLRVNYTQHLTEADEDGGEVVEPSIEACPRGLKRLFALLNDGERI